jgi:F-type H+-transporting ATPase subunit b
MGLLNDFSPGLFIMQAVILVILIFLMAKFAWRPILDALNTREEGIQNALEEAEKAKKEMSSLKADNEKLLKEARAEREAMLKEAKEMKDKLISEAKEEATAKATELIVQAQATIQREKQSALNELTAQVGTLAIDIAEKVVKTELENKSNQEKLVESMLADAKLN